MMAAVTETAPKLVCPAGATDCHMHFYGTREDYPLAPSCQALPPFAPVEAYRGLMVRLGLERVVIVQPSAYGKDNRCTLDALAKLGDAARAVVVVDESVTDAELERLTWLGVRAIRFFMLPGGVLPWSALETMAARVAPFGWHVQLQLDGRDLSEHETVLKRLPVPLVIAHNGKFLEPVALDHPGFRSLLRLVDGGKSWVKVSAPYETSRQGPPLYGDVGLLAKALIRAAPERMVWASNWPHPGALANPPDDSVLLDLLLDWAGDESLRRRILTDNPAELYGFGPASA
ncbi:MAG: amidohydrolase family protein [Alphaproteobacteria bacterium]